MQTKWHKAGFFWPDILLKNILGQTDRVSAFTAYSVALKVGIIPSLGTITLK